MAHGRSAGQVEVTIDGATILKAIGVNNPAAKNLEDMSRFFDNEVGDRTTSATVLASELLREPEKLIEQKLHPQTIIAGWRASTLAARSVLITGVLCQADRRCRDAIEVIRGIDRDSAHKEDQWLL